jgi:hypothetical protein
MALDVIFLLDGSTRSATNFAKYDNRFPHTKKFVTQLTGIQAYKAASKLANTSNFYVVDHDFMVSPSFEFDFIPDASDKNRVHAWKYDDLPTNPRLTAFPGYGGVYIFNKAMFRSEAESVNELGDTPKLIDEIASRLLPLDVIIASINGAGANKAREQIEQYASSKVVCGTSHADAYAKANEVAETENYYVVDARFIPTDFNFGFRPEPFDAKYVHAWKCIDEDGSSRHGGIQLLNRTEFTVQDYEYSFGPSVKFFDDVTSIHDPEQDSIIFLSYDEPNAEENWQRLKERFPQALRVHGVEGILNAHKMAAATSITESFFVVDGDSEVLPDFNFDEQFLSYDKRHYVHIWKCLNPVNGLTYGYGGVKMFHKSMFSNFDETVVDMSTLLGDGVKLIDKVATITHFDSDAFHAFRGAFRECAKLSSGVIRNQDNIESAERLKTWTTIAEGPYAEFVLAGANIGKEYGTRYANDLSKLQAVNKFAELYQIFRKYKMDEKKKDLLKERFKRIDVSTIINITNMLYRPDNGLSLTEVRDMLSFNELLSKFWLIDEINNLGLDQDMRALIIEGGSGTLGNFLLQYHQNFVERVLSADIDERYESIADLVNINQVSNGWRFKAITADPMKIDYERVEGEVKSGDETVMHGIDWNILIAPNCERLYSVKDWIYLVPREKLVVAQTVFMGGVDELEYKMEEFKSELGFTTIHYEGILATEVYDRLMVIGVK